MYLYVLKMTWWKLILWSKHGRFLSFIQLSDTEQFFILTLIKQISTYDIDTYIFLFILF